MLLVLSAAAPSTPSETAYTLREPIANTAIIIKTSNPSAAGSAPDS